MDLKSECILVSAMVGASTPGMKLWFTTSMGSKLIHRPEEALNIQSELIFVNAMVLLSQE